LIVSRISFFSLFLEGFSFFSRIHIQMLSKNIFELFLSLISMLAFFSLTFIKTLFMISKNSFGNLLLLIITKSSSRLQ
jgi:hypothetical protein